MTQGEEPKPGRIAQLADEVVRAALVSIVSKVLTAAAVAVLAAAALLVYAGGSVPAWLAALELALLLVLTFVVLWQRRRLSALSDVEDEAHELQETTETYDYALDRHLVYANHTAQVLDTLQRVVAGDIDVPIPDYIERGILSPARDVLSDLPGEDVRLSILLPVPADDDCFEMAWAAGHNLTSQSKYLVEIRKTLSAVTLETGEPQFWDDAPQDDRFEPNPKATRALHAMVSVPLRRGDSVIGVFNTVSSEANSFDPAEHSYLMALGGILSVAVNVWLGQQD